MSAALTTQIKIHRRTMLKTVAIDGAAALGRKSASLSDGREHQLSLVQIEDRWHWLRRTAEPRIFTIEHCEVARDSRSRFHP
jgi:hypothetical protein